MLRRNITYENPFTEKEVTEEHYFHLSKSELIRMEVEEHQNNYVKDGVTLTGMQAKLQRMVDSQDGKAIMAELEDIIRRSYGRKDGERFLRSDEIWQDFKSSEAFSQLMYELCTDATEAARFINGAMPGKMDEIAADIQKRAAKLGDNPTPESIAAVAAAEVAGESPAIEAVEKAAASLGAPSVDDERKAQIKAATPESPVELDKDDVLVLTSVELMNGVTDGRYKLATA